MLLLFEVRPSSDVYPPVVPRHVVARPAPVPKKHQENRDRSQTDAILSTTCARWHQPVARVAAWRPLMSLAPAPSLQEVITSLGPTPTYISFSGSLLAWPPAHLLICPAVEDVVASWRPLGAGEGSDWRMGNKTERLAHGKTNRALLCAYGGLTLTAGGDGLRRARGSEKRR